MSDRSPSRRRLQFSMLSLMLLMTATCLALGWWAWPRPVEVVALLHAPTVPATAGKPAMPGAVIDVQQELLTRLNDPKLMRDTVSIVGNGKLRMFRGRNDPAAWLRDRLVVDVQPNSSIVSIKLRVPAQFTKEAIEVVDYIALRTATRANVKIDKAVKDGKQLPPTGSDSPRILQTAAVTNPR